MAALEDDAAADDANDFKSLDSLLGSLLTAVAAAIANASDASIVLRFLYSLASLFFSVPMDAVPSRQFLAFLSTSAPKVYDRGSEGYLTPSILYYSGF